MNWTARVRLVTKERDSGYRVERVQRGRSIVSVCIVRNCQVSRQWLRSGSGKMDGGSGRPMLKGNRWPLSCQVLLKVARVKGAAMVNP
jgi:hypothetical protein